MDGMSHEPMHRLPAYDPISGHPLYVSEVMSDESGISLRGRFAIPRFARLTEEQSRFLETFLRCRGVLSSVEKELGLSYPTVRNRLDQLLTALELPSAPMPEANGAAIEDQRRILDQLERGEISVEEAKVKIRGGAH